MNLLPMTPRDLADATGDHEAIGWADRPAIHLSADSDDPWPVGAGRRTLAALRRLDRAVWGTDRWQDVDFAALLLLAAGVTLIAAAMLI